MAFSLSSTSFNEGERIPVQHTGDGADRSPSLQWSDPPESVAAFALICDDPDAPRGVWVHWVLLDIPPGETGLPEAIPATGKLVSGAVHGKNDFGKLGYGGPAPPPGKPHRYFFKLYALDSKLNLSPGATKAQALAAMKGHILGECQLMGTYQR